MYLRAMAVDTQLSSTVQYVIGINMPNISWITRTQLRP